jgi:hypothetical protein
MSARKPTHKDVKAPPAAAGPHEAGHRTETVGGDGSPSYCRDCRKWLFIDHRNNEIDVFAR